MQTQNNKSISNSKPKSKQLKQTNTSNYTSAINRNHIQTVQQNPNVKQPNSKGTTKSSNKKQSKIKSNHQIHEPQKSQPSTIH